MENTNNIDQRLTDLEVKASFAEDLLEQLNQIIIQHQGSIEKLTKEIINLREISASQDPKDQRNLRDEIPPHF
jgi:SlyX protein